MDAPEYHIIHTPDCSFEVEERVEVLIIKLILARKKNHISQKELSIRSGVPEITIARLESFSSASRHPRIDTLLKLALALNLELTLCGEKDIEPIPPKGHIEEPIIAKEATETTSIETGITEGNKCSACGTNLTAQT